MSIITAGDLERLAWKDRAEAGCADCTWSLPRARVHPRGQSSETVGRKAREHTRQTSHETHVYHRHVTVYSKPKEEKAPDD